MTKLHIAVDAHNLTTDTRGIGRYARALLSRFARRDDVRLTLMVRDPFPARRASSLRAALETHERITVRNRVPRDADIVWHPWNGVFFSSDAPNVATLHDVVPFAFPESSLERRTSQQTPFFRTAARAERILTDSRFTASEAQRFLGIAPDRFTVVALGVDAAFAPGDAEHLPLKLYGLQYVLYVGAHDAHKNVTTLAEAHERAFGEGDIKLVFTRPNDRIRNAIVTHDLDTRALAAVYRNAMLVAVPSLYEGFGLTVLEAMACGTPVIASNRASLPEVGGDCIRYVSDTQSVDEWTSALALLAGDSKARADLAKRGRARAALFSWEICAEQTLDALRRSARPH